MSQICLGISQVGFGIWSHLEHRFIPNLKFDLGCTKSEFQFGISQSWSGTSVQFGLQHVQLRKLVDAFNFNNILNLKRWTDIKDSSDRSHINWNATWGLFNYHALAKKSTTSFKHSTKVTFATKLLMNELPLQDKLVRWRPDLYKSHWKCTLCNTEQESWSHLWRCSNLQNRIVAILIVTKEAYLSLLRTYVLRLSTTFVNTFTSLPCWSLPSPSGQSQDLNFDSLVRGFIPTALTDLLSTVANKKEAAIINNSIFSTAQAIFWDDIWNYRYDEFIIWEQQMNISNAMKKSTSSGYNRNACNCVNLLTCSRASSLNRWKSGSLRQ